MKASISPLTICRMSGSWRPEALGVNGLCSGGSQVTRTGTAR
jgi:hypothetical protein